MDAIAISANDPDAVVPVLKKAMQRGIKVVSWDSGVAPAGRQIHLNPSNNALIGETNVKLAADALQALNVEKGEVAVLSATPTSTNQNIWIEEMKRCYRSIRRCSWSPSPTVTICRIKATAKRWVC